MFITLIANQRRRLLRNLTSLLPSQFYTKKGRAEIIKMNNYAVLDLVLIGQFNSGRLLKLQNFYSTHSKRVQICFCSLNIEF